MGGCRAKQGTRLKPAAGRRLTVLEFDWTEFYKVSCLLMDLYNETKAVDNLPEFMTYRIFYWMLYNKSVGECGCSLVFFL